MESLAEIYKRHCVVGPDVGHGDKGGTHSYVPEYERLLAPYRKAGKFMEIGLAYGLSIAMWREYFPLSCDVIGVDEHIVFDPLPHRKAGSILVEADATKQEMIDKLKAALGPVFRLDVVIDDASHVLDHQMTTFKLLEPFMRPKGIYIIEDILSLEHARGPLSGLHHSAEFLDLRRKKGRFDDVLAVFRF